MVDVDFRSLIEPDPDCTGPDLEPALVREAERRLGLRLPAAYVEALRAVNGGRLRRTRFDTPFRTSWAEDHFEVETLMGVGGPEGIDSPVGSAYLIEEWEYPAIGVVFAVCPSGGHDTVMLDYTRLNAEGEPTVAYIDEDRVPHTVADGFAAFAAALR
jgi:hypothetical protein